MYLPVQASRGVRDAAVCARAVLTEQNTARMYWKELSFAPKCFLIAYILAVGGDCSRPSVELRQAAWSQIVHLKMK